MRYLVSSEVNSDEILLDTIEEVTDYINQELKNADNKDFSAADFNILEVPQTCRACNELVDESSIFCSYECSKIDAE